MYFHHFRVQEVTVVEASGSEFLQDFEKKVEIEAAKLRARTKDGRDETPEFSLWGWKFLAKHTLNELHSGHWTKILYNSLYLVHWYSPLYLWNLDVAERSRFGKSWKQFLRLELIPQNEFKARSHCWWPVGKGFLGVCSRSVCWFFPHHFGYLLYRWKFARQDQLDSTTKRTIMENEQMVGELSCLVPSTLVWVIYIGYPFWVCQSRWLRYGIYYIGKYVSPCFEDCLSSKIHEASSWSMTWRHVYIVINW